MKKKYFNEDFISFFKELSANNHTEWFHLHKKRYEKEVKKPFEELVVDVIAGLSKLDSSVTIAPKDAIMRINRDIRFSKDKSPYQLYVSAIVSSKGKKDKGYPGFYIQLGAEDVQLFGGVYMPEKDALTTLRNYILNHHSDFKKVVDSDTFMEKFGQLQGELGKVLPPEIKAAISIEPRLAMKAFYFSAELPVDWITSDKLYAHLMEYMKAAYPVNAFFAKALESKA